MQTRSATIKSWLLARRPLLVMQPRASKMQKRTMLMVQPGARVASTRQQQVRKVPGLARKLQCARAQRV